jgi:hypothetical protein
VGSVFEVVAMDNTTGYESASVKRVPPGSAGPTMGGRKSRKPKKKGGKRSSLKKSKKSCGGKSQSQQQQQQNKNQQQGGAGALEFSTFGKESHIETGSDKYIDSGLHPSVQRIHGGGLNPLSYTMKLRGTGIHRGGGCSIAANPQMGGRRKRKDGKTKGKKGKGKRGSAKK